MSTGSEKLWPYSKIARPASRGHKVAGVGENAGAVGMNALLATCQREGVPAIYDSGVVGLVRDESGRGFDAVDAAERGRDADRAAAIAALRERSETGSDRRAGPTTRSSGGFAVLPRVVGRTDDPVAGIAFPTELGRVGLPEHHRACRI